MAVITALPDDDDAEYSQEEAEGGSQDEYDEEDNYEGEEDGEEEEEYSEEEEGDNDKENRENKTPIKSLGPLTLTPSSSKTAGGSVFGSTPSYANALASGVIPSSSPFSNLKPNQDELESDEEFSGDDDGEYDEEEEDEEEVVRPPRQLKSKQMTGAKSTMSHRAPKSIFPSSKKSSPFSHKKDEKKPVVFNLQATEKAGDKKEDSKPVFFDFRPTEKSDDKENKFLLFETKPTEKPEEKPVFGTSSSIISGPSKETPPSLFGGSTKETSNVFGGAKKEAPSLFDNATKETSIVSDKGKAVEKAPESSLFGSAAPKPSGGGVFGSAFGGPPATIDSSPFEKKETSQLPIKPTPKPESPKRAAEPTPPVEEVVEEEESDVESEVDFDADYSDNEDEKIREQLFHGPVKPSQNLPEIKKLKEVEVPEVIRQSIYPLK